MASERENLQNAELKPSDVPLIPYITNSELSIAVEALDIFCKSWCINKADTSNDWNTRCRGCTFSKDGRCLIQVFKSANAPYFEFYFGA